VSFAQRFRYPATYSLQTGEAWRWKASEYWYSQHLATWGQQPRGIFGADECIRPGYVDPRQGFETCGMVEFAKSFYLLGRQSGDPRYADRCEDLMLNHFPAAQTPDLKGLHYLTASNMPQLDAFERHDFYNDGRELSYSPHAYRCCQHNVAMGWPWYVENLWQATADGGLCTWLYGASTVSAYAGSAGGQVTIREDTDYPFSGRVTLTVQSAIGTSFPLYLRVPGWCRGLRVALDGEPMAVQAMPGSYVRIERAWTTGDRVEMDLDMAVSLTQWPRTGSVTVDRGPLSYSLRIEEEWRRCGGSDEWPEWEVLPTSPWNYGLVIDREHPERSLTVVDSGAAAAQPWAIGVAPLEIRARGRRIPGWELENQTVQALQPSPVRSHEPDEEITLIPLGCARLRIACFPVIGEGPEARQWTSAEKPDA